MRKSVGITLLQGFVLTGITLGILIQFVPYGRNHLNPPVLSEPSWNKPETRALAVRACFDCHSNAVVYPWYSNVAPVSWLVQHDVEEGRSKLNLSEWNNTQEPDEAGETISEGTMPPVYYLWLHPLAKLSDSEKQSLIDGFQTMSSAGQ